ncbi:MAG: host cell division inhibitor Icd-like protein [Serratia bockelmannii]
MNPCTDFQKAVDGCAAANYLFPADANSSARGESLKTEADSRLFLMRFFYVRNTPSCALIMVGCDGGAFALAGFFCTSLSTLLHLATPFESGLVRSFNLTEEAVIMATTRYTQHSPQFVFYFLAVRRADLNAVPHRESVTAPDELTVRRLLARDFVLLFAGRVPVQGGAA